MYIPILFFPINYGNKLDFSDGKVNYKEFRQAIARLNDRRDSLLDPSILEETVEPSSLEPEA